MATRLLQTPDPGSRLVRFVGDRIAFHLRPAEGRLPHAWRACLRTNLGRATVLARETITSVESRKPPTLSSWRDIPMVRDGDVWRLELPLTEVGYFRAKAYALDERGWQHWPEGPDFGVNVQPGWCRTGNTIYCAFPRLFGPTKQAVTTEPLAAAAAIQALDQQGYTVIPPSGKLRDLARELPHIFRTLGCRVLHLLPVNPTPTTYARFGRFGSPYACQDLLAVDPALVEFDRETTGLDQFRELAYGVHAEGGRLLLDMVVNHTGWGSTLQERHPGWFHREGRRFVSPGAWGTVWEDLVELDHRHAALRRELGEVFVEWCRRGVDGFRCDAGYKVPRPVWQYIIARVRLEFPDTVFLLEGLGGSWEDTENLLTEGGMQWAYSELFQNYDGRAVAGYLDYALDRSARTGLYVHYSETHDNPRLAATGRAWSLLRNRLCALTSVSGGFGFTCGVEWLAPERVNVHSSRGLAWDNPENLVPELAALSRLLASHPCFFDGARLTRLSPPDSPVYALLRVSADGRDVVLVLVNTDAAHAHGCTLELAPLASAGLHLQTGPHPRPVDLLGQTPPRCRTDGPGRVRVPLPPGGVLCLAPAAAPAGPDGDTYRRRRAVETLAWQSLARVLPVECLGDLAIDPLADWLDRDPVGFLGAVAGLPPDVEPGRVGPALEALADGWPQAVEWRLADAGRIVPVPARHFLVVLDPAPFRATLEAGGDALPVHAVSTPLRELHVACFTAPASGRDARLSLERYGVEPRRAGGTIRFLAENPAPLPASPDGLVLLTNGRGGMARLAVDLGAIRSKYDCLLGANLHPHVPVDRHIFVKRARVWINADGFLSALNLHNLVGFEPGPPAVWRFLAHAGDGRGAAIRIEAAMLPDRNTVVLRFHRPPGPPGDGRDLPAAADVRLTVRLDLEDRNFHHETKRNDGADQHFASHTRTTHGHPGFRFTPGNGRHVRAWTSAGTYHPQAEWSDNIGHPVEQSRGMEGTGDAWSPGWFEIPLPKGATADLVVCAEHADPEGNALEAALDQPSRPATTLADTLSAAAGAFVVRRGDGLSVIAGYPWFLDWGRDTFIAARGLLADGRLPEVLQILTAFSRFEHHGTLPNAIHGEDASNRDTSDAPLWFGLACEESHDRLDDGGERERFLDAAPARHTRPLREVLRSIARGYLHGTPNGIRVDAASGLVFSPAHFTWMDTNHPAATPREGYPIEIQALWIRLLRFLDRLDGPEAEPSWGRLADLAQASLEQRFWLPDAGWYADVLLARAGQPATGAVPHRALRSNALLAGALGVLEDRHLRSLVLAARRWLVVPGALRSLAPLPVDPPLDIRGAGGRLLNDPQHPYWGRYEGDEDTRRKPAYHNGTAWTWTLPHFCEALVRAWDRSPAALAAARAYLASASHLLASGCLGHLPEIVDGDAPHTQRGCDAQAWGTTETLRVWRWLDRLETERRAASRH